MRRLAVIKSELVSRIAAQNSHLYAHDVDRLIKAILDEIVSAMARRDRVELRGFGAFGVKVRPAWIGRNPKTGAALHVSEKIMPAFRPAKEMRQRLNPSGSEVG
jgi:integration host factor subunit beta